MKPHIQTVTVTAYMRPRVTSGPFVTVFFSRGGERSNPSRFNPTPSSMLRLMRWQAATLIASQRTEAQQ